VSRRPPSRLRWFALDATDDGEPVTWTVWLTEWIPDETTGHHLAGLTLYERHEILVAAWQSHAEILHTLMHEMMHAASPHQDDEVHAMQEERFIASAERQMFAFCAQMGLRVPDLPRGFDALRKRALALAAKGTA
jgi:hypothetical protein